jgi:lipid-A-disaccharide synthase-like uncharacterized protein
VSGHGPRRLVWPRIPSRIGGVKWEPLAAMLALLFVGLWLVYSPGLRTTPGAHVEKVRIAHERGVLEYLPDQNPPFRLALRDGHEARLTDGDVKSLFGDRVHRSLTIEPTNPLFRLFNITSWTSLAWIGIGLGGQALFAGRTFIQWLVSERARQSVVPAAFWWMSLVGGVSLFAYFAWRQDVVGVLGQCSGVVIYARNLRLIYKSRRRHARASLANPEPKPA